MTSSISFESTISGSKSVAVAGSYVTQLLPSIMPNLSHEEPLVGYHSLLLLQTLLTFGLLCPLEVVAALVCASADEHNVIASLALDILLTIDKQHPSMIDNRLLVGINACAECSNYNSLALQPLFHRLISPNNKRRDMIIVGLWRMCSDISASIGSMRQDVELCNAMPRTNKVQFLLRHLAELSIELELLAGVDVPAEMACHEAEMWLGGLQPIIESVSVTSASKNRGKKRNGPKSALPNLDDSEITSLLSEATCSIRDLYFKAAECRSWTSMLLLRQHVLTRSINSEGKYEELPSLNDAEEWEMLFTEVQSGSSMVVRELGLQLEKYSTELHRLLHLSEGDIIIPTRKRKGGGRPRRETNKKARPSRRKTISSSDEDDEDLDDEYDDA